MSLLSYRLVKIQIVDRKIYADKANNSYRRQVLTSHRRGLILDRHDEVIAHDIVLKSIYVDKYQFIDTRVAARSLACQYIREVVGKPADTEAGVIREACLTSVVTKNARKSPTWASIKESERLSMVAKGARRLLENLEVDEIRQRNIDFVVDQYYRPLGVSREKLRSLLDLKSKRMHVLVTKDVDFQAARKLEKLLTENWVLGFDFKDSVRREYKEPMMATHLVGIANHERKGVSGVEGQLNRYLEGRDGRETRYTDVRGMTISGDDETLPPKHGRDVRLTLDMKIQAVVEEELQKAMELNQCDRGAVVVMDPYTGEVLAMASRPHFNLNNREDMQANGFNYAVQAANETGSTIKIIATSAALNEGIATYDTEVDCGWGILSERGFTVKDHHNYGMLALWQVLQKSSNTGAWQFAKLVGREKFFEYAGKFGYGHKSGIRLVGESKGRLGDTDNMMDFSRCSYGYVLTASPLQITAAYCVIANGGKYVPPHIIKDIHAKNGKVIEQSSKKTQQARGYQVLKPEVAAAMRNALEAVTQDKGTARRARVDGYIVGGKTGTNHKVVNGAYMREKGKEQYITSFAGMCPVVKPNFVCVVVMDNPKPREIWDETKDKMVEFKRGGGTVAAPIFAKLVKRIAPLRGLQPNFEENE